MTKVQDEVERIEEDIKLLRIAYEKYFAGIERVEPTKERKAVKTAVRRLAGEQSRNTARRFRVQSLQASLITYESYWTRVCRQMEEGTFRRDRWRLARMQTTESDASAPAAAPPVDPREAPEVHAPPSAELQYPPSLRKLHEALVAARAKVGDTRPLSIEALAATVRKQVADIKTRFGCDSVEFKVAVKDGKVVLKAAPKRAAEDLVAAPAAPVSLNPASGAPET